MQLKYFSKKLEYAEHSGTPFELKSSKHIQASVYSTNAERRISYTYPEQWRKLCYAKKNFGFFVKNSGIEVRAIQQEVNESFTAKV